MEVLVAPSVLMGCTSADMWYLCALVRMVVRDVLGVVFFRFVLYF